ncbi:glutathionylspermidine synthase family protein [Paenibacillus glycinis]|uniref:Glutathionylspermidine synthase family protein n=1 Tax=Paenibacillus glycinis TaxID=2697035 RepID=A0ABW9XKJ7_9BACL|nr:glutathionylspermidine synthase family protein [Paenibacillus glycinis]NBD23140.1 glutathionylspermidine synthase family protein [Paenibacillus glycinis]
MTESIFDVWGEPDPDRAARVARLNELGFAWADLETEEYWIDQIVLMPSETHAELELASAKLWLILDKAVRHLVGKRELYELIGIPEILWDTLDLLPLPPEGLISRYARFDFAIAADGTIKLLELNADTPTGYVESAIATPWLCEKAGISSPNAKMAELVAAAWAEERPEAAACVGYGEHLEDSGTIEALVRHSGLDVRCVDCLELWVDEGVLKDGTGTAIKRMFALYPKEWLAIDEGGDALLYAVDNGHLALFNAPHSILLQSKGLQAAVWGLYELGQLFDAEERKTIRRYMLPTYNKPVFQGSFVSKSMFGREGGSVRLFDKQGQLEVEDRDGFDTSVLFPIVYQKRAELARIRTAKGEFHLLTGMFMLNGKPGGMLGRAGGLITGNTSHFIPLGVKD